MKPSNFQFSNPSLKEIYFAVNPDFNMTNVKIQIQNSFNIQIKKKDDANSATVELSLETNSENNNAPFKLQIKVVSDFKWENLEDEAIESMLNVNAPALLLSYMRPIVASITNSSNFPAYNLPFINFKD